MENTVEEPVQALTGEHFENRASETAEVVPTPGRPLQTWPHDDVRKLTRVNTFFNERSVAMVLLCRVCEEPLKLEGRDNGGASLMGCRCAVRRWL